MIDFNFLEKFGISYREENSSKKVIVGMSGGVDSSVAAIILKAQGYQVFGVFMKNWDEVDESGNCSAEEDYLDVIKVCEQLDIPYYSLNFAKEYFERVFKQFIEDYKNGLTPNPDIFCNKEIKFKEFYQASLKFGADFLATGHYCRVLKKDGNFYLGKGLDPKKDQSYFLAGIKGNVLEKVLFPLGELQKSDVRKIAKYYKVATYAKKDSTGVCFIGERDFKSFLKQYIDSQKGNFCTPDGEVVGEHEGACYYTIGQRKGLGLGGPGSPWYVVGKDIQENTVYVARDKFHEMLMRQSLEATEVNLINSKIESGKRYTAKVRYRQEDQECVVHYKESEKKLKVTFDKAQRALCKRQFVALYDEDICLGGGVISNY